MAQFHKKINKLKNINNNLFKLGFLVIRPQSLAFFWMDFKESIASSNMLLVSKNRWYLTSDTHPILKPKKKKLSVNKIYPAI